MAKLRTVRWQWDNHSAREIGLGKCIKASRDDFQLVASYLLTFALRWPDPTLKENALQSQPVFDSELRAAAQHIGLQLLGEFDCDPDMPPYPILRQNPSNACQTQQSLDDGVTWTVVFDSSICQPTIPPMIQLRQNPLNPAILQQSFNSGSTWTTAYDYSKYRPVSVGDAMYVTNISQTALNTIVNTYNDNSQTVVSIAPHFVYNGVTAEDNVRDILLCWACRQVIKLMCEAEMAKRNLQAVGANIGAAILGIVAAFMSSGIEIFSAGTGTPLVVAISGVTVGLSASLFKDLGTDILTDENAREDVACCMYKALKGATPDKSAFESSLNGCDFSFGSRQAQLAGAVAQYLSQPEMHAAWLDYAEQNYRAAQLGLLEDCPCPDDTPTDTPNINLVNNSPDVYPSVLTYVGHPSGHSGQDIWQVTSVTALSNSSYVGYDVRDGAHRCLRIVAYTPPGSECLAADINCSGAYADHGTHHSAAEEGQTISGNTRIPAVPNEGTAGSVFTFTLELV